MGLTGGRVVGVAKSAAHGFSKERCERIELVAGLGVADDAHSGETVQHLSRKRTDPDQANLRQIHLIHAELFDELAAKGFQLGTGDLGENVLTRGIDLLGLPQDTLLEIGDAVVRVTGLRNPCGQIEAFMPGLLKETIARRPDGSLERKCGVMGVVERGGSVAVGDAVAVRRPAEPHRRLEPV